MDILCFGIIVVDHRRTSYQGKHSKIPLKIVDKAVDLYLGGIPIVAVAMNRMGFNAGLMGNVGRDIAGYGLKAYLKDEIGIDVQAIKMVDAPTSSSFIQLTPNQRYIEHTPGASEKLLPTETELALISDQKPKLMAIGYSGLLPKLDEKNGIKMADWITNVQKKEVLVALDTHTVPPYNMLKEPLGVTDIFICNREEAEGITDLISSPPELVIAEIWSRFVPKNFNRYRLFGLATVDGIQLAYGNKEISINKWLPNPYYKTFVPKDLTGAGDYLRSGIYSYIIKHTDAFRSGSLNIEKTGMCGLYVASQCLNNGVNSLPPFGSIQV